MNLTELCIKKPVLAWMMMAATILFGIVAFSRIGISQFPDVDFPTITVSVTREGAAPEVIENDVVEIVEEALVQVEGVKTITSSSRQGSASITVELDLSRNIDLALQDVTTRVSQAQRNLPEDLDPPVISKSNPEDQPILWVGLSGPFPRQQLADFARYRVREKLQTIPGVGEITLGGYLDRNVRIWVDAARLDARGITVNEVISALRSQHVELPAGRIEAEGREIDVRVLGEALNLEQMRALVVQQTPAGPVYLSDVALVEDGFEDLRRLARVDGEPAQGMGIRKQRGSNAVAVATAVKDTMASIQKDLPEGMTLQVINDSSRFIEQSVHHIEIELILAVLLTAFVCWLFLGSLSSTLNVILAIPMSLLGTIGIIYFLGYTLNTFTLLALSLAVGIVVDDAIMVLENIYRHSEEGKDRVTAAREGTKEITFAALAATLAVCAIFLPVVFIGGVIGKFFMQFGITLSLAVLLSYIEAISLAPARCAQLLNTNREHRSAVGRAVDRVFDRMRDVYARMLGKSLRWPLTVLGLSAALLAASMFTMTNLPAEFVPPQDQSRLQVRFQTAVGSDLNETDAIVRKAEAIVSARPEVARIFTNIGGGQGSTSINSGNINVTLVEPGDREKKQSEIQAELRKELSGIPGLKAQVQDLSQSGLTAQRGFPVEFSVRGSDWDKLIESSQKLMRELVASGAVVDLDSDYRVGMPELRITPDRARAADLGVSVEEVATTINALVGGVRTGKYSTGGRRIDVRLRLLADQRARPEALARLRVRGNGGELVPMASLVTYEERPALQAITRQDRERAINVFGNIGPGWSQDKALAKVEELGKDLPEGARVVLSGASVAFRESMSSLIFALFMGIAVAYMILGAQFNSFLHPVTVLTILPLSVAGAAFALWLGNKSLNVFSMIGLLLLMGIVKKNSIILVDYANQVREQGKSALEAMLEAGPVRLRPILMTSIATMMAAIPAALALGAGSETRAPMALAVIGGLLVSTLLSLVVVPAFYIVADRMLVAWQRWRKKGPGDASGAAPDAPSAPTAPGSPAPAHAQSSSLSEPLGAGGSSVARMQGR